MKRFRAWSLIRRDPCYRRDAFAQGLVAAGGDVRHGAPASCAPGDVLVIWNRYDETHRLATQFEAGGGIVLVAENGYLGPRGLSPHGMDPRVIYALAVGGHNGAGRWVEGGAERFEQLGVALQPWRTEGAHVLVCPNRSFGIPGQMMPPHWAADVCKRLHGVSGREIRLRPHPGNAPARRPLAADLAGAWAVVIWSSSAGVQALLAGIPVICEAPRWICKGATAIGIASVAQPYHDDAARRHALQRLAWAQWHVAEIATGEPFRRLLG